MHHAIGDIIHLGERRIRFEADLGDGDLHFTDVRTGARVRVEDPDTGDPSSTTIEWLLRSLKAGQIYYQRASEPRPDDRRGDLTQVDEDAADTIDPLTSWRRTWVREARANKVKCEAACKAFIAHSYERISSEYRERKGRTYKRPGASTLKRWIIRTPQDFAPGAHVSKAGRQKGQSQLTNAEDALVHEAALYFWADKGASIVDAEAVMARGWNSLKLKGDIDLGEKRPSYEAVRSASGALPPSRPSLKSSDESGPKRCLERSANRSKFIAHSSGYSSTEPNSSRCASSVKTGSCLEAR